MKQTKFLFVLTVLLCVVGARALAHDIAVANADGITIYYKWANNNTELSVSYRGTEYYYYSNRYIGNVVIPESATYNGTTYPVTSIGGGAFYGCSGLTSVTIPNSVKSISEDAFLGTGWFKNQPNGLVYAGKVAYKYKGTMPKNTSISLMEGTLGITNSAFSGCSGLTSVTIPNSVMSIGKSAFYKCSGLTSITIPNSVSSIGEEAFYLCLGLKNVTIPNSVTSIGKSAFKGCRGLTSVSIGKNVTYIQNGLFAGCTSLKDVHCYIEEVPFTATDAFDFVDKKNATLHVPDAAVSEYKSIAPWSYFGAIVGLGTNSAKQTEATPVLIQSENGRISVSGAGDGTAISVFGTNGVKVGAAVSHSGQAVVDTNLSSGSVAIVKIGEKSLKVAVK